MAMPEPDIFEEHAEALVYSPELSMASADAGARARTRQARRTHQTMTPMNASFWSSTNPTSAVMNSDTGSTYPRIPGGSG